ncbi:MAG: CRISPR-associated endoribonuclease Cas6 [Ignavibacteriales bacterium]
MRLILKMKAIKENEFPYNYNSFVSAEISRLFGFESPEFKKFLSSKDFRFADKSFSLFTFNLHFENVIHRKNKLHLRSNNAHLYVSFPLIDEYVSSVVMDKLPEKQLMVPKRYPEPFFTITKVEQLPEPDFTKPLSFIPKSPLVLSTKRKIKNILRTYYMSYQDDIYEVVKLFREDLCRKYSYIYNTAVASENIGFQWDHDFITKNAGTTKKLRPKFSLEHNDRKFTVMGNMVPFSLKGNPELLKVGYYCGFGKLNFLGFGFSELQD